MKTLVQNYRNGKLQLVNISEPMFSSNEMVIKTKSSIVSVGTEKSLTSLAKQSIAQKAKARPDLVKRVIEKAKTEGVSKTYQDVISRLENLTPLGYSACGTVVQVGVNGSEFKPGDFVAVIGANIATHSSYICAPEMMCVKVDHNIGDAAGFGMLGIISMHGIRCTGQQAGSVIGVMGLGVLGILTMQILKAYGYQSVGYDPDIKKVKFCRDLGLGSSYSTRDEYFNEINLISDEYGVDATIITAASKSRVPVDDAIQTTRNGGKIVVTGVVDIHPDRNELWHKEIEIIVSRAGGPGGLDETYERGGIDISHQYARWTQKRNLTEFFRLIKADLIDPKLLITSQTHIDDAIPLFDSIAEGKYTGLTPLIYYDDEPLDIAVSNQKNVKIVNMDNAEATIKTFSNRLINIDMIGAGQFARASLLPHLTKMRDVKLRTLVTKNQTSSFYSKNKFSFDFSTQNIDEIFNKNDEKGALMITTRHANHFEYTKTAVEYGYRHIFVEKPMVTNREELNKLTSLYDKKKFNLMVGYNRRFSPHAVEAKTYFGNNRITNISYIVNAGFVDSNHWVFSPEEGRSRIVGEMCHFFDLFQFLTGSKIIKVTVETIDPSSKSEIIKDNLSIICKMENGAVCNLAYYATGNRGLSRENIYIFGSNKSAHIENFSRSKFYGPKKSFVKRTLGQNMGYAEELKFFKHSVLSGNPVITFAELCNSTETCFAIEDLLSGVNE